MKSLSFKSAAACLSLLFLAGCGDSFKQENNDVSKYKGAQDKTTAEAITLIANPWCAHVVFSDTGQKGFERYAFAESGGLEYSKGLRIGEGADAIYGDGEGRATGGWELDGKRLTIASKWQTIQYYARAMNSTGSRVLMLSVDNATWMRLYNCP